MNTPGVSPPVSRWTPRGRFVPCAAAMILAACGPAETQATGSSTAVLAPTVVVVNAPSGSSGGAASAPPSQVAVANTASASSAGPQMQPRARLGHYSSVDGTAGFVFDRTAAPPLARLDGSRAVVSLTSRPGPLHSTEFVNEQQDVWIRVTEYGEVLFDGPEQHEGIAMLRDADAQPLH